MKYYFLPQDFKDLQNAISEIQGELKEAGSEIGKSMESGETWHDNAVFDAAQEHFGNVSRRLQELSTMTANAQCYEPIPDTTYASLGHYVLLNQKDTENTGWYYLGSSWMKRTEIKADGKTPETAFRISIDSPLGKAVKGKEVSGEAVANLPVGKRTYIVKEIKYIEKT